MPTGMWMAWLCWHKACHTIYISWLSQPANVSTAKLLAVATIGLSVRMKASLKKLRLPSRIWLDETVTAQYHMSGSGCINHGYMHMPRQLHMASPDSKSSMTVCHAKTSCFRFYDILHSIQMAVYLGLIETVKSQLWPPLGKAELSAVTVQSSPRWTNAPLIMPHGRCR